MPYCEYCGYKNPPSDEGTKYETKYHFSEDEGIPHCVNCCKYYKYCNEKEKIKLPFLFGFRRFLYYRIILKLSEIIYPHQFQEYEKHTKVNKKFNAKNIIGLIK
jgi:hypothetical protein